jgi:hypothetical protein
MLREPTRILALPAFPLGRESPFLGDDALLLVTMRDSATRSRVVSAVEWADSAFERFFSARSRFASPASFFGTVVSSK